MDNAGTYRDTYPTGHPTLEGRVIFTNSDPGRPDAAFIKLNDPIGRLTDDPVAVAAGYVVRTRADADTYEARANNTTVPRRRDRERRAVGEHATTRCPVGRRPVRHAVLRADPRRHAGALQPDQRAVVVHVVR